MVLMWVIFFFWLRYIFTLWSGRLLYCGMTGVTLGLGSLGGSLFFFDRRYQSIIRSNRLVVA